MPETHRKPASAGAAHEASKYYSSDRMKASMLEPHWVPTNAWETNVEWTRNTGETVQKETCIQVTKRQTCKPDNKQRYCMLDVEASMLGAHRQSANARAKHKKHE